MSDPVNKPHHYMLFADGTEAIDVIRAALTPEEFAGYCKGNVLKYRLRAGKKDKLEQDIAKANTYADMLERQLTPVVDRYDSREEYCHPLADCTKCPSQCR